MSGDFALITEGVLDNKRVQYGLCSCCIVLVGLSIIVGIGLRASPSQNTLGVTATLRDGRTSLRIVSPGIWSTFGLEQPRKGDLLVDVYPAEQGWEAWIDSFRSHSIGPHPPAGFEDSHILIECTYAPKGQTLAKQMAEIMKSAGSDVNTLSRQFSCPVGPVVQLDRSHIEAAYYPSTDERITYVFMRPDSHAPGYQIKVSCFATQKTKHEMFSAIDFIVTHLGFVDVVSIDGKKPSDNKR